MADISKGNRSTGRRSSILKRALADIDVNVKEKKETKRRPSKRVSFAETYVVKEFPRDSPQTKNKQNEVESEEHTIAEPVILGEQPWVDGDISTISFAVEEGETTFISGMAVSNEFPRESTRIIDQNVDIVPTPQQMGNWEPVATEVLGTSIGKDSVFVPPQPQPHRGLSVAASSCFSSSQNRTVIFNMQNEGNMDLTSVNMSVREKDMSSIMQGPPKMSAADFTRRMMGSGGQLMGMAQMREERTILFTNMDQDNTVELTSVHNHPSCYTITTTSAAAARRSAGPLQPIKSAEDKTVIFSASDAACDMNLTQNLSRVEDVSFCNDRVMQNQSLMEAARGLASSKGRVQQQPAIMSAKAFLMSLKSPGDPGPFKEAKSAFVCQPTAASSFVSAATHTTTVMTQPEDMDMSVTMELTGCKDTVRPPMLNASLSCSLVVPKMQPITSMAVSQMAQSLPQLTSQPTGMTRMKSFPQTFALGGTTQQEISSLLHVATCTNNSSSDIMYNGTKTAAPVVSTTLTQSTPATIISVRPTPSGITVTSLPAIQPMVYGTGSQLNNSDVGETMELTGCVENTRQLLQDAGSCFIVATTQPARTDSITNVASRKPLSVITTTMQAGSSGPVVCTTDVGNTNCVAVTMKTESITQMCTTDHCKVPIINMETGATGASVAQTITSMTTAVGVTGKHEALQLTSAPQVMSDATVRFSSGDSKAVSGTTQTSKLSSTEGRFIQFLSDDAESAMDMAAATRSEPEERTVRFSLEDMGAAMDITHTSQNQATTQSAPGELICKSCLPPACVEDFLTDMDIELFELKVRRRRSGGVAKPDLDFETAEDKLNVATVVKCECEIKKKTLQSLGELVKQKEKEAADIESSVMRDVAVITMNSKRSDAEALLLRKSVQGLLSASRKRSQAEWKQHKADMLRTYADTLGETYEKMCEEMGEMTSFMETVARTEENLNLSIEKAKEQLLEVHSALSHRRNEVKHQPLQQSLQYKQAELDSLREKITSVQSTQQALSQQVSELKSEEERVKGRQNAYRETQQQLGHAYAKLQVLHGVLSWRLGRMEDNRVEFHMLCDSVQLTITLQGNVSPQQQIQSLSASSLLREGSQPWAELATGLVVDGLTMASNRLLSTFPCRSQLPQLLDEVSRLVEDARSLCLELKFASLKYLLTISGNKVVAELFSVSRLRKVCLSVHFPADHYPLQTLNWHIQIIMGDISETQVHGVISQVETGSGHFTRVLNAVHTLIS